jgi:putative heme-binding domain-containing protein
LDRRAHAVRSLLAGRSADPEILPQIVALLNQPQTEAFRRELIAALAATGEESVGRAFTEIFATLPLSARGAVYDALISRPVWTGLLLDALEAKKFTPAIFGRSQTARLASYPEATLAARAKDLFAKLGGEFNPAKDEIIARLLPAVEKPGNIANGKATFTANCATCHQLGNEGFELGPNLDGIGYHSAAELLVHIVDPNRVVDDEHRTWNVTTKDDMLYSALIGSENESSVRLRLAGGVTVELNVADIVDRKKSGLSIMPEGFESLGEEGMRDLIAYIQASVPAKSKMSPAVGTEYQMPPAAAGKPVSLPSASPINPPSPAAPMGPQEDDPRTIAPSGQGFAAPRKPNTLRVLLVGAGSSHHFPRYFLGLDADVLRAAGGIETAATPNLPEALTLLPQADVLVLSANHRQFATNTFQAVLTQFADAGKGVVVLHAGVWSNWPAATGFNHRFVGGGTRSHGYGEFVVTVKQSAHPVLRGVPASFTIVDENYHVKLAADASVQVLAENAPDKGSAHPSVWVVKDPKARIVCISLGHADEAHRNPAFQTLLVNAVKWAGETNFRIAAPNRSTQP